MRSLRGRKAIDLQIKLPKLANKNVNLTVRLPFQTIIISVSTYVAWQALILKLFAEFWKFIFNQHFVFFSWQPMFKRLDSGWLHRSHERHWKTKAYYHSQRKKIILELSLIPKLPKIFTSHGFILQEFLEAISQPNEDARCKKM